MPSKPLWTPAQSPGATQVGRLNGRFAQLRLVSPAGGAGAAVAQLFEWELEIATEFIETRAHGDYWNKPIPLAQSWTGRARGYFTAGSILSYLGLLKGTLASGIYQDPPTVTFFAYNSDTTFSGATLIFQGDCYVQRGRLTVPLAMVEQEIEFIGYNSPTLMPAAT